MPTSEEISAFQEKHIEPLVNVPSEFLEAYKAGKLAVLMPSPELIEGERICFEALGFAKNDHEALRLLHKRIVGLPAVHKRAVYYYSASMAPVAGEAF